MSQKDCENCDGTGVITDEVGDPTPYTCPECQGQGCLDCDVEDHENSDLETLFCDYCDESGRDPEDQDEECPKCFGAGTIVNPSYVNTLSETDADDADSQEHEDKGNLEEGFSFGKFMDKILIQEGSSKVRTKQEDSPLRRRAASHQERPLGRIRYGVIKLCLQELNQEKLLVII